MTSDVLIIGAGAAGLALWRGLHAAGLKATVLEARDRIGGRVWTMRDEKGHLPIELGAEFVHGRPQSTCSILDQAGIDPVRCVERRLVAQNGSVREVTNFWEIIERVNQQIDPKEEISYASFLDRAKATEDEKRIAKSYVEGFNAARADLISAPSILVADEAAAQIDGAKQFRIPSGYDRLIDAMADRLPRTDLHLSVEVKEIKWASGRVEISANTESGARHFRANCAAVTVPIGILRARAGERGAIRFEPPLPAKTEALRHLEMGNVIKVTIIFREKLWAKFGAFAFMENPGAAIPVWWTHEPLSTPALTGWAGGPPGEKLAPLSEDELRRHAIISLAEALALPEQQIANSIERFAAHDWSCDPYSRGAYSYPGIGGLEAARVLAEPVSDTLFFAGEGTDWQGANGTVAAAIESGGRVLREILESRFRPTPDP